MGPAPGRRDNGRVGPGAVRPLWGKAARKPGRRGGNPLSSARPATPTRVLCPYKKYQVPQTSHHQKQGQFLVSVPGSRAQSCFPENPGSAGGGRGRSRSSGGRRRLTAGRRALHKPTGHQEAVQKDQQTQQPRAAEGVIANTGHGKSQRSPAGAPQAANSARTSPCVILHTRK